MVPSKRGQSGHWCGRVAVLAVLTLAVLGMAVLVGACSGGKLTTTTERQLGQNLQVVKINERSNGKVVLVSPGFLIQLELRGQPSLRNHWDVLPPNPTIVLTLPGPRVIFDEANLQGTYTFTALALRVGTATFTADYVDRKGQVERTFTCTFEVISSNPTSTTTTEAGGTTTTTEATTTTTERDHYDHGRRRLRPPRRRPLRPRAGGHDHHDNRTDDHDRRGDHDHRGADHYDDGRTDDHDCDAAADDDHLVHRSATL